MSCTRMLRLPRLTAMIAAAALLATTTSSFASSGGITGRSGNPATGGSTCTACHTQVGGASAVISGPTTVAPGSVNSYTLTLSGGPLQTAGLNVSASAGTITDTNPSGTRMQGGELTQSSPLNNGANAPSVSWTFDWQAPAAAGGETLYAAGLSANGGGTAGDATAATSLAITIAVANQSPTAVIDAPTQGTEGVPVAFNGANSSDPDGTVVGYDWDFGDGNMGAGPTVEHTFAVGTWTVTLTVTDDAGDTGTTTHTIQINPVGNQPPTAAISAPATAVEGTPVTLDGSGSSDPDGSIVSHDWDLGDGNNASGATVTHTYAVGTWTATLTVTDDAGDTDTATHTITVTGINQPQPPVADAGGPYSGEIGQPIQFDGSGSMDPDGTITAFLWNFGDGNTSTDMSPMHAYASEGTFDVTLQVTDNDTQSNTASTTATISPPRVPGQPSDGEALYDQYCASCHGKGGTGGTEEEVIGEDAEDIVEAIEEEPDMTFLATELSAEDIAAIGEYLEGLEPDDGKDDGNSSAGEALYDEYCGSCHGKGGTGGPDEEVVGEDADDIREAIEEESDMAYLAGVLSDEDIAAIGAYLEGLESDDDGDGKGKGGPRRAGAPDSDGDSTGAAAASAGTEGGGGGGCTVAAGTATDPLWPAILAALALVHGLRRRRALCK
ncbi:MAG: PKD domain-containing protein [Pseudomonadota bacterium]|nr:MAG: PKD domain-containing protein [Pseudomonadota bacterium]